MPTSELQAVARKLARWRRDPVAFVRETFGATPDAWQEDGLISVRDHQRVAFAACKGPGKSCLLAWVIWWFLTCHRDAQVMALSITADNLRDNLWKELAYWRSKSPFLQHVFDHAGQRIVCKERPKTWWCSARSFPQQADKTQQANTLAGFHGENLMVVLDEVGDYPHGVVAAAEGIFATEGVNAHLVVAGNPTSTAGPLYKITTIDAAAWHTIHITGDPDDPKRSPRISIEWAREQIRRWGRDNPWVMVNVFGEFPPAGDDQLIPVNAILAAQKRDAQPGAYERDPIIWGLDPARFGGDSSALMRRQGIVAFRPFEWRGLDGPQLAVKVTKALDEAKAEGRMPEAIFIDVGGVGSSVYDHLQLLGWHSLVRPVDFGGAPSDDRYADKRTEMWIRMAEWIRNRPCCLPQHDGMREELCSPQYDYAVRHRQTVFILESKQKMRSRGVKSPNIADALALTFAEPVVGRRMADAMLGVDTHSRAVTDYELTSETLTWG